MNYRDKIKKAIECPQFGNSRYGEWGALRYEQRVLIKKLLAKIDYKKTNKINTYQIINSCRLEDAYFLQHRFLC